MERHEWHNLVFCTCMHSCKLKHMVLFGTHTYDSTFKIPYVDYTFPVVYAMMERKTTALYKAVLEKVKELVSDFQPSQVLADFEEAPTATLREVLGDQLTVSGCWFHYSKAIMKRLKKIGLTSVYQNQEDTQVVFR